MKVISIDLKSGKAILDAFGQARTVSLRVIRNDLAWSHGFVSQEGASASIHGQGYLKRIEDPRKALHLGVDVGTWVFDSTDQEGGKA